MNHNRQRRLVLYVGDLMGFRDYWQAEVIRLVAPGDEPHDLPGLTARIGNVKIERGRWFLHIGTGTGTVVDRMRGLSASAVDVVYGVEHRASDATRERINQFARIIERGASKAERQRERDVDEAMRQTGEPYEIIVEAFEALDACNDYPPEPTS